MDLESSDKNAWFAAKRTGIGAGWPIAWQGWAGLALMALSKRLFCRVAARRTRGGWQWRRGGRPLP